MAAAPPARSSAALATAVLGSGLLAACGGGGGGSSAASPPVQPSAPAPPTPLLLPTQKQATRFLGQAGFAAPRPMGNGRQVFFVSLGGFDLHNNLATQHPVVLGKVASALASFYNTTVELDVAHQVTAFTSSEFGRTLTSNGEGSDHGWGSHHFVLGGAVNGGRNWGQLPEVSVNGADDVGQGRLLPTTSVDQLAATLSAWMGLSDTDLTTVLPQIGNYSMRNLGFMGA